jgi:hypothetical protein
MMTTATLNFSDSCDALDSLIRVRCLLRAVGALSPAVRRELDALADWIDQDAPSGYEATEVLEKFRREWRERQAVIA